MMISTAARPSVAKTHVLQALDQAESAMGNTAQARTEATAAQTALDGYEPEVRAIKFDRPDRDVSPNGHTLRAKTQSCAAPSGHGLELANGVQSSSAEIRKHIDEALQSLTPADSAARRYLQAAARDTKFLNENSLPHLTVSLKLAHRQSQEEVSPYLTEVQEDAPGRDVGRFAEDIGQLFADSRANYRQGDLGGKYVQQDLAQIKADLQAARDKMA